MCISKQIQNKSILAKKLVACIFLGSISFAITIFLLMVNFGSKYNSNLCLEHGCILSAARLLEGMDTSVNPCDDFYEYMCGKWPMQHQSLADGVNSWFSERTEVVTRKIKNLLETPHDKGDVEPVRQMRKFYNLCTDTDDDYVIYVKVSLNRRGLIPIFQILDKLGLPRILPTVHIAATINLAEVLSLIQRLLNFDILIQLSVHYNSATNTNVLSVGPSTNDVSFLMEGKEYKSEMSPEEFLIHRVSYMTSIIDEVCGGAFLLDDVTREAIKIVFLEAQLKFDVEEAPDDKEVYMTLNDLQDFMFVNVSRDSSILMFSWQDYLATLTKDLNISLSTKSMVHVNKPLYFQTLGRHLMNLNIINFHRFTWWKVVQAVATHTTDKMRMHEYIFDQNILRGFAQPPTRSKTCIDVTKSLFSETLAFLLSTHVNTSQITDRVTEMLTNIKTTFKEIMANSSWIDETTKNLSIRKLDSMKTFVGYPQHFLDSEWITERYKKFKIVENDFVKTLLAMRSSLFSDTLMTIQTSKKQYKNYENESWSVDPTEVNAFYSREINSIAIPAGILQYPFYIDGIQALNYGAIGSILGHELTHGFDNEGKNYDWKGDKKVTWSGLMTSLYNNRSRCFIDQYSRYVISNNLTVNGNLTLAENIADNGGIKEAFYAYEKYKRANTAEKLLPGFENFTHQQLLFMSYANIWCKKQNEASSTSSILDEHSPNRYRVIGSLSNLEEFSHTWKCDKNTKMNPKNKCLLW